MAGSILKFKNEGKLHICRGPGLKSWCMLIGLITIGLLIAGYLTDSMIGKLFSLLICLVLGLIFLDEWEDCVMDLYKNKVILIRSNWYDRLFCRVPEENTRILSLNNIIGIQFLEQGLSFLLSTGSLVPVTKHSLTYREGICLSNHISSFLRLNRIEPVELDFEYDGDDWEDAQQADLSESVTEESTREERTPQTSRYRWRDEIKVLSEPSTPQPSPQ